MHSQTSVQKFSLMHWWLSSLLVLMVTLGSSSVLAEQAGNKVSPIAVPNPGADLWNEVRQRNAESNGRTQIRGTDSAEFMRVSGEEFRDYRLSLLIPYAPYFLVGMLVLLAATFIVKGRIKIPDGRSGQVIKRFETFDRVVHWYVAILFIFLALTGLLLLLGRYAVLPVFGKESFGLIASACKEGHNLFGPPFLVGIVLMAMRFAAKNIPNMVDVKWLLKAGGAFGGHPQAGYFNAGEKIWFWLVTIIGLGLCVSGLILLFPNFEQGREYLQWALVAHGVGAVVLITLSFGHMYVGSVGMEGSLDSMSTGYVDSNWAKSHHDLWYQEVMQRQSADNPKSS